ncbi:MAG: hypothetical protein ACRDJ4_01425 [Actinomycetota bacterium]
MPTTRVPRAVLVTRPTEYEALLAKHGTRDQAGFFLSRRGGSIEAVEGSHRSFLEARRIVVGAIPASWRRSRVDRADLDRFLFEPDDIILALGQDGLVANVAKYLTGQTVIGLNPDVHRHDGILVPHVPAATAELLQNAATGRGELEVRTMVEAALEDGQTHRRTERGLPRPSNPPVRPLRDRRERDRGAPFVVGGHRRHRNRLHRVGSLDRPRTRVPSCHAQADLPPGGVLRT